jgi:hypothetical protein
VNDYSVMNTKEIVLHIMHGGKMNFKDLYPTLPKLKRSYIGSPAGNLKGHVKILAGTRSIHPQDVEKYFHYNVTSIDVTKLSKFPSLLIRLEEPNEK